MFAASAHGPAAGRYACFSRGGLLSVRVHSAVTGPLVTVAAFGDQQGKVQWAGQAWKRARRGVGMGFNSLAWSCLTITQS